MDDSHLCRLRPRPGAASKQTHVSNFASGPWKRINSRFREGRLAADLLKIEHYEPDAVYEHDRAAEFCYVSSLHDGMNLVAKEFVAFLYDERQVILANSQARPGNCPRPRSSTRMHPPVCCGHDLALTMPQPDREPELGSCRFIQEFNIYRWAGKMLLDAAHMRMRGRLTQYQDGDSASIPLTGRKTG